LPSFWTLNELIWEDKFLIGGSTPGVPLIGIGKSKNISYGQTAALCDISDLWQETVNEDLTKYFVDGEWKDLRIVKESIKIKGKPDLEWPIMFTHRGPIMQPHVMKSGGVLFGGALPDPKVELWYSHMWGGMYPGDDFISIIRHIANGLGVKDLMDKIEKECVDGYKSLPMNLVLADN
jgi:acyl-homoserine lactone acylase PvdQ